MRPDHLFDIATAAGAVALVSGVALIHRPSAVILAGVLLLAFGLLGARAWAGPGREQDRETEG